MLPVGVVLIMIYVAYFFNGKVIFGKKNVFFCPVEGNGKCAVERDLLHNVLQLPVQHPGASMNKRMVFAATRPEKSNRRVLDLLDQAKAEIEQQMAYRPETIAIDSD